MMTRRDVLWIAAGIPIWAAAKEFWNEKTPEQWTKEEIEQMLTNSPWAKPASVSFHNSIGLLGLPGYGGRPGVYGIPAGDQNKKGGNALPFQAVIRWESARPIRIAEKSNQFEGLDYYVVAAIGDFPATSEANEDAAAREQRRESLQEFTMLDRRGDSPIYLDRIESVAGGMRFYFSKLEPITPSNKEITFSTKIGPLEMKAKFPLKDMGYRGKLEL